MATKILKCTLAVEGQRALPIFVDNFLFNESLGKPSRLTLSFLDPQGSYSFDDFVGQKGTFQYSMESEGIQQFSGVVTEVKACTSQEEQARLTINVRDSLVQTEWGPQYAIFENQDLQTVLATVLDANGVEHSFSSSFNPTLALCTQYGETDYQFILRLLQQHGLGYRVLPDGVIEIFNDKDRAGGQSIDLSPGRHLESFEGSQAVAPIEAHLMTYHYDTVELLEATEAEAAGSGAGLTASAEIYGGQQALESGSSAIDSQVLTTLSQQRAREAAVSTAVYSGRSSHPGVRPGTIVEIKDVLRGELKGKYMVIEVTHRLADEGAVGPAYHNQFSCLPADMVFVPARTVPLPRVTGYQIATVLEPDQGGDTDPLPIGRARVKFQWSGVSRNCQGFSAWARVAQLHAGADHGAFFMPDVGDEVIVIFNGGDPDEPVIVGSVYTGDATPDLPVDHDHKNQIKSIKTKAGNKIILNDDDSEQVIEISHERNKIELKSSGSPTITMEGGGDITVEGTGSGSITLKQGAGSIVIKTDGSIELTGPVIKIGASAQCEITAPLVRIN